MKLRYKGEDHSKKLKTGQKYDVDIRTIKDYIVVFVKCPEFGTVRCWYKSPGTLSRYWKVS